MLTKLEKVEKKYLWAIIIILILVIANNKRAMLDKHPTSPNSTTNINSTSNTTNANSTTMSANDFANEYPAVGADHVFTPVTGEQIVEILRSGSGVVYLGFNECGWCQAYVPILNQAAKQAGIEKIYYFDILADRREQSSIYHEILALLGNHLDKDEQNLPRVYVPDVSIVKNGQIIFHNNDTSQATSAKDGPPEQYWTSERREQLLEKLVAGMRQLEESNCGAGSCNL